MKYLVYNINDKTFSCYATGFMAITYEYRLFESQSKANEFIKNNNSLLYMIVDYSELQTILNDRCI